MNQILLRFLFVLIFSKTYHAFGQAAYENIYTLDKHEIKGPVVKLMRYGSGNAIPGLDTFIRFFDASGRLIRTFERGGRIVTYSYNKWGYLSEIWGEDYVRFYFTEDGKIKEEVRYYQNGFTLDRRKSYEYSDSMIKITNYKGYDNLSSYELTYFDKNNLVKRAEKIDDKGNVIYTSITERNSEKNIIGRVVRDNTGAYDSMRYLYNIAGKDSLYIRMDRAGYIISKTSFFYDDKGRLIKEVMSKPGFKSEETIFNYYENGLESEIHKGQEINLKKFNRAGKIELEEQKDATTGIIIFQKTYTYDSSGKLIRSINLEQKETEVKEFSYDGQGNIKEECITINGEFKYKVVVKYEFEKRRKKRTR